MNGQTFSGSTEKILVVDDAAANLQFLVNLLREHRYTVHPASDGQLALEIVHSNSPDLILLDIRMPGMDGYEVCRRLKADERTRAIPIIFISILEEERDKVKGFQAGAVDYITKPFQPEEVLARIKTHLRLRELTERLEQTVAERTAELMASERRLANAQQIAGVGCWEWSIADNKLWWSDETFRIFGIDAGVFGADFDSFLAVVHPDDRNMVNDSVTGALQRDDGGGQMDYRVLLPDGTVRFVHEYGSTEFDEAGRPVKRLGTVQDITSKKRAERATQARLRILEIAHTANVSLDRMLRLMLDEIELQTESRFGFYHFVEKDQRTLSLQTWSTNTLALVCAAEGNCTMYPIEQVGVWADCVRKRQPVIHNDCTSLSQRRGMPDGHPEVVRELVVPIFRASRIVALIGVGNKQSDYSESDVQTITFFGDFFWEIVERKRAQDNVLKLNKELELRVKERTAQLQEKNQELERANKIFVGRELRMVELKERIRELEGAQIPL